MIKEATPNRIDDFDEFEQGETTTPMVIQTDDVSDGESSDEELNLEKDDPNPNSKPNKNESKNYLDNFQQLLSQMKNDF